ncbi:MAG: hypothetical protein HKL82_07045 [Acidimicrobiaceae bacterium]|nr:hypothetical protein [Acidimicrobiaceae bacterium]
MEQRSVIQNTFGEWKLHVDEVLDRVRSIADARSLDALILSRSTSIAWATGGLSPRIDRTADSDPVWLIVSRDSAVLVTNVVEAERLSSESRAGVAHFSSLVTVPWSPSTAYAEVCMQLCGNRFGIDRPGLGGVDVSDDLIAERLSLTGFAQSEIRCLGGDVTEAVETSARSWSPGEVDREIAARLCFKLEKRGIEPTVILVGGDERVRSFRHPVAVGESIGEYLMLVVVGMRKGLHVATTRFVSSRKLAVSERRRFFELAVIQSMVVSRATPGSSYGTVYGALDEAYRAVGHAGDWREHFQGGPIGYQQREFELSPDDQTSRWYGQVVKSGDAVAFNPSFSGGFKVEDTYLVGSTVIECVTRSDSWPLIEAGEAFSVAGVLEI